VNYASEKNVSNRLEMITNGILLRDKHFETLGKNLTRLIVSIEGLDSTDYLNFTQRKIDFQSFVARLKEFSTIKDRSCTLHIKIHNSAVTTQERLARFHELFYDIADEIYVENLINLWPNLISNLGINTGHRFVTKNPESQIACAQIFKSMQINFDGKVMPCCIDWQTINVIGNVESNSLIEIWNGERIRRLQMKHLNGERKSFLPCAKCTMNEESDVDSFDHALDSIKGRLFSKYQKVEL
jgi:radical SAM protein with 4Fe4S-binding SPASM domain